MSAPCVISAHGRLRQAFESRQSWVIEQDLVSILRKVYKKGNNKARAALCVGAQTVSPSSQEAEARGSL